jgi:hypothetical protein
MTDCSVFYPDDAQKFTFIDFATAEFPPQDYDPPWLQ